MKDDTPISNILVTSIISHRDKAPRVDIQFNDKQHVQLEVEAAIKIGLDIIHVAMGAYADAFLFNWFTKKVFVDDTEKTTQIAGAMLIDFREYREKLELAFKSYQQPK